MVDGRQMDGVLLQYLAGNTHRLAYHVTAPRSNLRAPAWAPDTGSEQFSTLSAYKYRT